MAKNLVIVESPAKAKTIEKYLGKEFTVLSSVGHIRSIVKKTKDGTPPIDTKNGFKTVYEIDPDKKKTVAELRKAVKVAEEVWLATDEDREGEAIAWHLCEALKLNPETTKRIVFHEITKSAIEQAIKQPRTVDMHLVRAQQARQILDRLVGFELSPVVWQKVPGGKSAGRVQSPAVRLLVERENEIEEFESKHSFKITADFLYKGEILKAEIPQKFATEDEAKAFLETITPAMFSVKNTTKTPSTRNPAAPFTTSTLQQEANSRIGMSAKATMGAAQKLYQEGKITYMRTDSVNLSNDAIAAAAKFVEQTFGKEYVTVRKFKTKNASAQEAHEAIRPTDMSLEVASSDPSAQRVYALIRSRAVASQMAPAKLENTTVTIEISTHEKCFEAKGQVITFAGFLKMYPASKKDEALLPHISSGETLKLQQALAKQIFARPPARYSEGALVKKLEELGIGRPSTYATIINTVQVRGYAEKGENEGEPRNVITLSLKDAVVSREIIQEKSGSDRGKLVPTGTGKVISDFLKNHFEQIVNYDFTANVEEEFDRIAQGQLARNTMLEGFYSPFHALIENSGGIDRSQVAQAREIGIDPKSGKQIFARFGRFGPMLQIGATTDEEKPTFAPMPRGVKIETVTLEQALHAFKLPRLLGTTDDGQEIKANIGRFGPYIQVGKLFVSIKPLDPHDVTLEEAKQFYAEKLKSEAEKNIADFGDGMKILNGRWGAYVTDGKKNAKIAKDIDPKTLTHADAKKILKDAPVAKGRFAKRAPTTKTARTVTAKRKSPAKKTTKK